MQHVDEPAVQFDGFGGRKLRGGAAGIDVAANGRNGRDLFEGVQDGDIADVARMKDVRGSAESLKGFGTQQAVSIGDDADHRKRSLESFADAGAGIEEIAEAVADEIEGEDAERDSGGREEDEVGRLEEVGAGVVEHGAPGGGRRLHTEAEKAERSLGEDGSGHADGSLHQYRLDDVGQDVVQHEADITRAKRARSLHKLALLHRHDLAAYETSVIDPSRERERNDEVGETRAEEGDDGDREQNARQSEKGVGEIEIDNCVRPAFIEARDAAENAADKERGTDDRDRYKKRDT